MAEKKKSGLFGSLSRSVHGRGHGNWNGNAQGERGDVGYVPIVMQKRGLAPGSMPVPAAAPGAGAGAVGVERRAHTATASAAKDPLLAAIEAMAAAAGMDPQPGQLTNLRPAHTQGKPLARAPSTSHHSHSHCNPTHRSPMT